MKGVVKANYGRMGREVIRHVVPRVLRPARTLWNEIIGFLFFALGLWAVPSVVRAWREFEGDGRGMFRIALVCAFSLIMFYFGLSSFRRAKRISRS